MDVTTSTQLADPVVGRLLDRRYRVEHPLARGGMASVYLATDTRIERTVAVKVMHPALAEDADFVARFEREAKAAARIVSQHVVSVSDAGSDDGLAFLVMEYVRGRTLREVLRARGRLTPAETLEICEPVALALAAAHAAGLVHRDVKPENVLLGDDGQVKVADFGLAHAVEASPLTAHAGLLLGTVAYLAPELVEGGPADARSDVYAAGVMLFELLTGRQPFGADTPLAVAYRHVHERIPAPGAIAAGIPAGLDELCLAMTSPDPGERPPDGAAVARLVARARRELAAGGPSGETRVLPLVAPGSTGESDRPVRNSATVPVGPTVPVAPSRRPARSRRRRRIVVLAVLLALCAGTAVAGWRLGSSHLVRVARFTGLDPGAARRSASNDHLAVTISGRRLYSATVPAGLVAAQQPAQGGQLAAGGTVLLYLSRGPRTVPVPAVAGLPLATARDELAADHLRAGGVRNAYSSAVARGAVIASRPAARQVAAQGSRIQLVVSRGPAPVRLPDLVGLPAAGAAAALRADHLREGGVSLAYSSTVPAGDVSSQSAPGGTTVPYGSTVTLVVSRGPRYVTLPRLAGDSPRRAEALLAAEGLSARVEKFPGTPGATVVGTSPAPGSRLRVGSVVTLYVF